MARPLIVPVTELRRRVGTRRPLERVVDVDTVGGLEPVAGTAVPPGNDIELDLVVESVLDGVTVTGRLRVPWRAECRRCLEPVEGEVEIDVQELFEADPTPGETYPLAEDHVDLAPLVRDAVLLNLPLSVLCGPDCAGPDPQRFPAHAPIEDEAGGDEDAVGQKVDPRWAALGELRFQDEGPGSSSAT